jgi:hypothetical protein
MELMESEYDLGSLELLESTYHMSSIEMRTLKMVVLHQIGRYDPVLDSVNGERSSADQPTTQPTKRHFPS